ncbi:MAG: hypothetical protein FWD32_02960 [Firmicutes bacterium]|nr:hypothetical protein [Bacillota bacterium]
MSLVFNPDIERNLKANSQELSQKIDDDVFVIILQPNSPAFNVARPFDLDVCGRPMHTWIANAIGACPSVYVQVDETTDIMSVVQNNITDFKYTAVLYADTPLLTRQTFLSIIDYIKTKKQNVLRLIRGWVFNTSYVKNASKVYTDDITEFEQEDFITAFNFKELSKIRQIQNNRILDFWREKGVDANDDVRIDADVNIGGLVQLGSGVVLAGNTSLGSGVIIGRNSILENCVVGSGVKIEESSIIKDAQIGNDCYIGSGVIFCNFNGKVSCKSVVGKNVVIGSNCNIIAPITLEDGCFIAVGSTIADDVPADVVAIARAKQINRARG